MAYRIYTSGNMVAIYDTEKDQIDKYPRNQARYRITGVSSDVRYNIYRQDPVGDLIPQNLDFRQFEQENGDPYANDAALQADLDSVLGSPG